MNPSDYEIVWSIDRWKEVCQEWSAASRKGLDFETGPDQRYPHKNNALRAEDGAKIAGIAIAWKSGDTIKSAYGPIRHWRESAGGVQLPIKPALSLLSDAIKNQSDDALVVVHNLQMELQFMLSEGVVWPKEGQIHDLMIAARVLNMGVGFKDLIGLKVLQAEYLGRDMTSKNEMDDWLTRHHFKKGRDIWRAPVAIAGRYAQDDARDTLELWLGWEVAVYQPPTRWWWNRAADRKTRKDLYELEVETAIQALMSSMRGNRVDKKLCDKRSRAATALQAVASRWIRWYLDMPTINPGSSVQMRGILFFERFGIEPSLAHLTKSFHDLTEREQSAVLAGKSKTKLEDYASLDVEALKHYAEVKPEHSDLFFMMSVYRKCSTADMWFSKNFGEYALLNVDEWWDLDVGVWFYIIYNRLRTVGTVSGRMASSDYNVQQVPKRFKMLLDADRLCDLLRAFLPHNQFIELIEMLDVALAKNGDEAKALGVNPGDEVFDFSARAMFIPRPGRNQRSWDLSQVEMRLFAHYSGNRFLCDGYGSPVSDSQINRELKALSRVAFDGVSLEEALVGLDFARFSSEENPFDIHKAVATELNIGRKSAKKINFGIVYGMGQKKLARSLGFSLSEGKTYLTRYHARFPEINTTQAQIKNAIRERGYIFDAAGRRYPLDMSKSYIGLNRLIQGYAASVFKIGFVRVCQLFAGVALGGIGPHPITRRRMMHGSIINACIHDEMLGEVLKHLDHGLTDYAVRACMTLVHGLKVPLGASSEASPDNWDACSDFNNFDYRGLTT